DGPRAEQEHANERYKAWEQGDAARTASSGLWYSWPPSRCSWPITVIPILIPILILILILISFPPLLPSSSSMEQAGTSFPEFSHSRTKLWQLLLTLPPRRPKDRSPTRTPAGNLRSSRRRSGKTGWGHPLCGTNVSL